MKKLLVTLFLLISSIITYSQSGVGYLNYTMYNTNNSSYRNTYPSNDAGFVNLFNTATGTSVYKSGTTTAYNALFYPQNFFTGVPNGGGYFGIKTTGYFVPKETGTYIFGIDGDDAVDFLLDGVVVTSFYGAHGFGGYRYGNIDLVAGRTYTLTARFQQVGGGWGMTLVWKRPSQSSYNVQSDECYSTKPNDATKKAIANFNFNTSITPTTFSTSTLAIRPNGSVDITPVLDSVKVNNNSYKMNTSAGQVEWIWAQAPGGNITHIGVDLRKFNGIDPSTITYIQLLDGYSGPVTYLNSSDGTWARYDIPSDCTILFGTGTNGYIGTSQYLSSIRNMGGGYMWGLSIEPTFTSNQSYKPQSITLTTTNNLSTLYNSIVTVSDVYLAFQEYSNQGLFGNQSGTSFTQGIQYQNADVNDDGQFNEADCFLLLQHLTGTKSLVDTFNLNKTIRLIPQTKYDSIGKSNWNTFTNPLGSSYTFDINTGKSTDTINLAVAWKGDVNLSHSTTPLSNNLTSMSLRSMSVSNQINTSIVTEIMGDSIYAYITLDPLAQTVMGVQFQLNYDNSVLKYNRVKFITKGTPTNFGVDNGGYINLGSLITNGSSSLDNTTQYVISFTANQKIDNILGLISIGTTDAINQSGTQLKVIVN